MANASQSSNPLGFGFGREYGKIIDADRSPLRRNNNLTPRPAKLSPLPTTGSAKDALNSSFVGIHDTSSMARPTLNALQSFEEKEATYAADNLRYSGSAVVQLPSTANSAETNAQLLQQVELQLASPGGLPTFHAKAEQLSESTLRAIAKMVDARMSIEVGIREGLAREIGRLRDVVYSLETAQREAAGVAEAVRSRQAALAGELIAVSETSKATASALASASQRQSSASSFDASIANALATEVASVSGDMRQLRMDAQRTAARVDMLQRAVESTAAAAAASQSPSDVSIRAVQAQMRDVLSLVEQEARSRAATEEGLSSRIMGLQRVVSELQASNNAAGSAPSASAGVPASPAFRSPGNGAPGFATPDRRMPTRLPLNDTAVSAATMSNIGNTTYRNEHQLDAVAAMADPSDDPTLHSNRVVTKAILETYLSGIRSTIDGEREARRRDMDSLQADTSMRIDRATAEVAGFRSLVESEVKSRVEAVVEATSAAVAELAQKQMTANVQIAGLSAALVEEKARARDASALTRDMIAKRCTSIEEGVRAQAQTRVRKEQALGDAILRGLAGEQKERQDAVAAVSSRVDMIAREVAEARHSLELSVEGAQASINRVHQQVLHAIDLKSGRLQQDMDNMGAALGDRCERIERDVHGNMVAATGVADRVKRCENDIIDLQESHGGLDTRVSRLEGDLPSGFMDLQERCRTIEASVTSTAKDTGARLTRVESRVEDVESRCDDLERASESVKRTAEEGVAAAADAVTTANSSIAALSQQYDVEIEDLKQSLASSTAAAGEAAYQRALADMQTLESALNGDIDRAMDGIEAVNSSVDGLKATSTHHGIQIAEITVSLAEHADRMVDLATLVIDVRASSATSPIAGADEPDDVIGGAHQRVSALALTGKVASSPRARGPHVTVDAVPLEQSAATIPTPSVIVAHDEAEKKRGQAAVQIQAVARGWSVRKQLAGPTTSAATAPAPPEHTGESTDFLPASLPPTTDDDASADDAVPGGGEGNELEDQEQAPESAAVDEPALHSSASTEQDRGSDLAAAVLTAGDDRAESKADDAGLHDTGDLERARVEAAASRSAPTSASAALDGLTHQPDAAATEAAPLHDNNASPAATADGHAGVTADHLDLVADRRSSVAPPDPAAQGEVQAAQYAAVQQDLAATRIQAIARGWQARKEVDALKQQRHDASSATGDQHATPAPLPST